MAVAEALLKSAGLLPIDATERDSPRHTGSEHPDAVSSSVSLTPMLQGAAVTDDDNYTGIVDETRDTILGYFISFPGPRLRHQPAHESCNCNGGVDRLGKAQRRQQIPVHLRGHGQAFKTRDNHDGEEGRLHKRSKNNFGIYARM